MGNERAVFFNNEVFPDHARRFSKAQTCVGNEGNQPPQIIINFAALALDGREGMSGNRSSAGDTS